MSKICPKCGGHRFKAYQMQRHEVIVDGDNNVLEDPSLPDFVDCECPYGPYICTNCGTKYRDLNDIEKETTFSTLKIVKVGDEREFHLPDGSTRDNIEEVIKREVAHEANRYGNDEMSGYYAFRVYHTLRPDGIDSIEGSLFIGKSYDGRLLCQVYLIE